MHSNAVNLVVVTQYQSVLLYGTVPAQVVVEPCSAIGVSYNVWYLLGTPLLFETAWRRKNRYAFINDYLIIARKI